MDSDGDGDSSLNNGIGLQMVEHDDIVEIRRAVSSGEPSLDGSVLDLDEDRGALSDSDIRHAARSSTIAAQVKGPSSDALEESCRLEAAGRESNTEWEDILGSGQLMKRVLIPASEMHEHDRPKDGMWVTLRVIDTLRGIDSHHRLKFITGYSMVIDAIELVVKLMYVGETCAVKCRSKLAYGENGLDDAIAPGLDMEYTIELLEIGVSPKFTTMDEEEISNFVQMLKDRGGFYFNRGEYEKAIFVYKRATGIIDIPEDDDSLKKLLSTLHSNLAVCYSKLGDYDMVLQCTDESIRLYPQNTKALFRRATALSTRKEYDLAVDLLNQAILIEPNDAAVQGELNRISGLRRRRRHDERQLYKKMLAGAGDLKESSPNAIAWLTARPMRMVGALFCFVMFISFLYFLSQL